MVDSSAELVNRSNRHIRFSNFRATMNTANAENANAMIPLKWISCIGTAGAQITNKLGSIWRGVASQPLRTLS